LSGSTLKRLFLAHGRELQSYLTRRMRDAETAADLTQETFLRYAEQGAEVTDGRAWLYRTARNLMIDHQRAGLRRRTRPLPPDELARLPEDRPGADRETDGRRTLDRMHRVVEGLPPRTREIFRLNRIEGLSYADVARRLDISESSVQKHLAKALAVIMREVRPEDV
jgi:RNA polymerase sigma-70 factor (ECF subfamily)